MGLRETVSNAYGEGPPPEIEIHPLSLVSVKVETLFLHPTKQEHDSLLSTATGYLVKKTDSLFLVSNLHVMSGRNFYTGAPSAKSGSLPNHVRVYHHTKGQLGSYETALYRLRTDALEPQLLTRTEGKRVDVAALPITIPDSCEARVLDHGRFASTDMQVFPSDDLSIVGFPFGLSTVTALPIWKTGHVASELDVPFGGQECFLVDASTRGGMSGSPVYRRTRVQYTRKGGGRVNPAAETVRFLGTYAARLEVPPDQLEQFNEEQRKGIESLGTDIGMVWRASIVDELLLAGKHPEP